MPARVTMLAMLRLPSRHMETCAARGTFIRMDIPRFLILPWIQIPDLGSHIFSTVCRHLPDEWTRRYNVTPVLMETFVEIPTYTGTVYCTSGWIHAGTTEGRGRYDR